MVKRAAMQQSAERHAGALMSAVTDELAAVKRCFEAVRQEPVQVQGGRSALPRLSGGALGASHLIRRIYATWTGLQVRLSCDRAGGPLCLAPLSSSRWRVPVHGTAEAALAYAAAWTSDR